MSILLIALHWLVANGLYKDLVAATIAFTVGRVLTWRPLKRHNQQQEKIANLLDTSTPGGLSDVVAAMGRDDDDETEMPDTPDFQGHIGHTPPHVR